uniref:alpha-L-arabinofuranosidase C-terminal domain-containing protein n=1 Tax=Sphingomonas sp. TaxID=28214 RepID=UPI003B3A8148
GLSLHNYTVVRFPAAYKSVGFGEQEYAEILKDTLKMDALIRQHSAIMDKYDPEKKVGLYVDEWGLWADPTPGSNPGFLQQQNTLRDAMLAALNLNIFMRHADRVRGTNIAQMINVLQAMILTDGPKMVLTPTYHLYHMYVPFQDATVVPMQFDAGTYSSGDIKLPRVDAIAARDSAGKLWLALVNIDATRPVTLTTAIDGASPRGASGRILAAAAVDSHNDFANPNRVAPKPYSGRVSGGRLQFDLPARSIAVVQVQ